MLNVSNKDLQWSADEIADEFCVPRSTVFRKLKEAGFGTKKLTTVEVCRALFGDLHAQRLRLAKANASMAEQKFKLLKGDSVSASQIANFFCSKLVDVKAFLEHSHVTNSEYLESIDLLNKIVGEIADEMARQLKEYNEAVEEIEDEVEEDEAE
jgi:hypothetical protein